VKCSYNIPHFKFALENKMPTPIGHLFGGVICLFFGKKIFVKNRVIIACAIIFAQLPDIDLLFGLVQGNPNQFHHTFTHSFVFVLCAGLLGGLIVNKLKVMQFRKSFVLFTISGVSHLLLDLLALDTSAPFGAPIFWPLSNSFYISPITIFSDVHRSSSSHTFWASLFSWHNFETILIEIMLLAPIVALLYIVRKKMNTNAK
jgi:membrane-bound metal-dependent hydrolase YbcI (DUF457 family)